MKKLVIEIIYDDREDVHMMLNEFSIGYVEANRVFCRQIKNSSMNCSLSIVTPLVEPRIEEINGKRCLVFPSSMNKLKR